MRNLHLLEEVYNLDECLIPDIAHQCMSVDTDTSLIYFALKTGELVSYSFADKVLSRK